MASTAVAVFLAVIIPLTVMISPSAVVAQTAPPLAAGLSYTFYNSTCANVETLVRTQLTEAIRSNPGLAPALLRIHFHDCFVQGCDGSVLLDRSAGQDGEKEANPNLTLRPAGFAIINSIRAALQTACGRVVSCSDIAALAARDSVFLSGGPDYRVPLGRRDGSQFANLTVTLNSLPGFNFNVTTLLANFSTIGLDINDLVALSGGHTIGIGHCGAFEDRLYPTQDNTLNSTFAAGLRLTCPAKNVTNTTNLDVRTPNVFDNQYYVNLANRQGLFFSDQDLFTDARTRPIVNGFAANQTLFFERFAYSVVKMGMIGVLTGSQGEIRANCSAKNPTATAGLETAIDGSGGVSAF